MKTQPIVQVPSPFVMWLSARIADYIAKERKSGTVSMSRDCLRQCTAPNNVPDLQGKPLGGNLPWQYAQRFDEAVNLLSAKARAFVIG